MFRSLSSRIKLRSTSLIETQVPVKMLCRIVGGMFVELGCISTNIEFTVSHVKPLKGLLIIKFYTIAIEFGQDT